MAPQVVETVMAAPTYTAAPTTMIAAPTYAAAPQFVQTQTVMAQPQVVETVVAAPQYVQQPVVQQQVQLPTQVVQGAKVQGTTSMVQGTVQTREVQKQVAVPQI